MAEPAPQPQLLDLEQFGSLEDALSKIQPRHRYRDAGLRVFPHGTVPPPGVDYPRLFFLSMITRSEGLHGAIAREARKQNAHAVFLLLRAFAEDVALVIYLLDHPKEIPAWTVPERELPKGAPKRRSTGSLIDRAVREAPQFKAVYRDLSEIAHFGSVAMWASHSALPEEGDTRRAMWSSTPCWRSEKQALIACALTLELAEAMERYLQRFAERHLSAATEESHPPGASYPP
jgi:hypothetical protein